MARLECLPKELQLSIVEYVGVIAHSACVYRYPTDNVAGDLERRQEKSLPDQQSFTAIGDSFAV